MVREWSVNSNTLPASTSGSGTAASHLRNVRGNSSGFTPPQNLCWDHFSNNPYYSHFQQQLAAMFLDDVQPARPKNDLVNRRNTGRTGSGHWGTTTATLNSGT
ncbi:MAG: hypothetical protein IPH20_21300 [Bacteroidales bacterium]|nr:hypothetical protein [Bacteroidales bacterium]